LPFETTKKSTNQRSLSDTAVRLKKLQVTMRERRNSFEPSAATLFLEVPDRAVKYWKTHAHHHRRG
jgi:hypothetical protein